MVNSGQTQRPGVRWGTLIGVSLIVLSSLWTIVLSGDRDWRAWVSIVLIVGLVGSVGWQEVRRRRVGQEASSDGHTVR